MSRQPSPLLRARRRLNGLALSTGVHPLGPGDLRPSDRDHFSLDEAVHLGGCYSSGAESRAVRRACLTAGSRPAPSGCAASPRGLMAYGLLAEPGRALVASAAPRRPCGLPPARPPRRARRLHLDVGPDHRCASRSKGSMRRAAPTAWWRRPACCGFRSSKRILGRLKAAAGCSIRASRWRSRNVGGYCRGVLTSHPPDPGADAEPIYWETPPPGTPGQAARRGIGTAELPWGAATAGEGRP